MNSTHKFGSEYNINYLSGTVSISNSLGKFFSKLSSIIHISKKESSQLKLIFNGGECTLVQFDEAVECERCYFDIVKIMKVRKILQLIVVIAITVMFYFTLFKLAPDAKNKHISAESLLNSPLTARPVPVPQVSELIAPTQIARPQSAVQAQPTATTHLSASQLSTILSQADKAGRFTIPLGSIKSGPVMYVFADPNCPHCKEIEPTLAALATEYNVEVFPVAVIGDEDSRAYGAAAGATALCSEDRASMWKAKVNKSEIPPGTINTCATGTAAIKTNIEIYHVAGFIGTPTLVNASGIQYPDNLPFTREAIKSWLDSGVNE